MLNLPITINIAAPEVIAIPIIECHEALIDLKQQDIIAYGPVPEHEWTVNDYTKMRKTVYEKLCRAQQQLPHGWRFRVYEGFRSLRVQQMLFDEMYAITQKRYPTLTADALFYETTKLVSPIINADGSRNIPAHNTGGAVDIEMMDEQGGLVDMGMEAKDWQIATPELCMTHSTQVSDLVRQHRELLFALMQAQGFVNYYTEWWHFSYGDRYWAYHQPIKQAIYGSAEQIRHTQPS